MERVWSARRALGVLVLVLYPPLVLLPARMAQLHEQLAAVLVHPLARGPPERDFVVVVDRGVVDQDAATDVDRGIRRDDRSRPPLGEFLLPVDPHVGPGTVVVVPPARDVGPEDPILDLETAGKPERFEDDRVRIHRGIHRRLSSKVRPKQRSKPANRPHAWHADDDNRTGWLPSDLEGRTGNLHAGGWSLPRLPGMAHNSLQRRKS